MTTRSTSTWRERLASPLTWHYAGFAVLLLLVIGLAVRVGLDWAATNGRSTDALAGKQIELKAMDLQTAPLRGLDKRVEESRSQIKNFYAKRIPASYSSFAARIGDLAVQSVVRLSRLQYTQGPRGSDLTEISLDAGITGTYPQIMHFINSVERDQNFFVIRTMALTGQQGGMVSLRLKLSTWLRPADAEASGLPPTPDDNSTDPSAARPLAPGKEGE
jgi:type IV pilus assembly protein PilO